MSERGVIIERRLIDESKPINLARLSPYIGTWPGETHNQRERFGLDTMQIEYSRLQV